MDTRLCGCGCGEEVKPGKKYRHAHHWRAKRIAAGIPDEKVCERCGETYRRDDLNNRQSNIHWMARRFCSTACQEANLADDAKLMRGESHPSWKGDAVEPNSGRMRARRQYVDVPPCEVCGANAERHHRDGDTLNNAPENIAFLCRLHHIGIEDRMAYRRTRDLTPEQRQREREYHRAWRSQLTPEQQEARRARSRESMRRLRERRRKESSE